MEIEARLMVFLKGADLVAETAYLTLTGKMNFGGKLLALKRFDSFRFLIESDSPEEAVSDLQNVLARQSTFYNQNKHGHVLECSWEGGSFREGPEVTALRNRVFSETTQRLAPKGGKDFVGQSGTERVIFEEKRIFLIDSLVEEQDPTVRSSVANKLQADLGGVSVSIPNRGTLWWLVLCAPNETEARGIAERVVVSERRDRGLLLNPNYQRFEILSSVEMEPTRDV